MQPKTETETRYYNTRNGTANKIEVQCWPAGVEHQSKGAQSPACKRGGPRLSKSKDASLNVFNANREEETHLKILLQLYSY